MEIGDTVLSRTTSDVVCIPDCNDACLISWRNIHILCDCHMVGEDGIISVLWISDHSTISIAELTHACHSVLQLALHKKIYTVATHF